MNRPLNHPALIRSVDHVTDWIFDLDNTLYPARCNLFAQVDRRIGLFIERLLGLEQVAARDLQKRYFREHGTTPARADDPSRRRSSRLPRFRA